MNEASYSKRHLTVDAVTFLLSFGTLLGMAILFITMSCVVLANLAIVSD